MCLLVTLFVHFLCSQVGLDDSYACSSADIMYIEFGFIRMHVHGLGLHITFTFIFTVIFLGPSFRFVLGRKLGVTIFCLLPII